MNSNRKGNNLSNLVFRYEKMLENKNEIFFDSFEFEDIVDFYIEKGKYSEAMICSDFAFNQFPFSSNFPIKKAQILTILERVDEAEKELNIAESLEPINPDLFIAKGSLLSKDKKHTSALKFFYKAKDISDNSSEILPFIAFEYQSMGKYVKAIKYLSEFLKYEPLDEMSLFNISFCFEKLKKYDEGIMFFENHIEINPYSDISWYHLGLLQNKIKNYQLAIESFSYSIIINESFTAAYHEKAKNYSLIENYEQAIKTYLETFKYENTSGYTFLKIGICYKNLTLYQEAIKFFKKSCSEDPQLSEAWMEIAICNDKLNFLDESIYYVNKAISLNPDDTNYILIQTKILVRANLYSEAILGFEKLIKLGVNEPNIWIEYAKLMFKISETHKAIKILKTGLNFHFKNSDLLFNLGIYMHIDGNIDIAKKYLIRAISLNPNLTEKIFSKIPLLRKDLDFSNFDNTQ